MGKERRKFYRACLSCPHNTGTYGRCGRGFENWYFRVSKKNGCSLCGAAPQLSTKQIENIRRKKKSGKDRSPSKHPVYTDRGRARNPENKAGNIPVKIHSANYKKGAEKRILVMRENLTSSCRDAILRFGESSKRFRDYMSLKTGGIDEASGLSVKDMRKLLPEEEQRVIDSRLTEEKDLATCMRWRIRGLSLEDSIRKALVDRQVRLNCS